MHIIGICLVIVFLVIGSVCAASRDILSKEKNEEQFVVKAVKSNNGQTVSETVRDVYYDSTTEYITSVPLEVDNEWEDLVLGGPTVVNYLSLCMVLASSRDQPLRPWGGSNIHFITHPNSLRATLSQVASAMQVAFEGAHADLIRIQHSMDQIPDDLKAALYLIKISPDDQLKKLLPYTLRNMERAAAEGSNVSKIPLSRFVKAGKLVDEVAQVVAATSIIEVSTDYLVEAHTFATDIKIQWDALIKLFTKFSERADLTQQRISNHFMNPIQQTLNGNSSSLRQNLGSQLETLISAAIAIDQSAHLLQTMTRTYEEISKEHMASQIVASGSYLILTTDWTRTLGQRQLWQNILTQSKNVVRLSQTQQYEFVEMNKDRRKEYASYSLASTTT